MPYQSTGRQHLPAPRRQWNHRLHHRRPTTNPQPRSRCQRAPNTGPARRAPAMAGSKTKTVAVGRQNPVKFAGHRNDSRTKTPLASNRMMLHQRRCTATFQPTGREPPRLTKRLCVPPAQEFGHFTSVCHRPNGRRRETENRPPYPKGIQATYQGPSAAIFAVQ